MADHEIDPRDAQFANNNSGQIHSNFIQLVSTFTLKFGLIEKRLKCDLGSATLLILLGNTEL
jgi:hypothetical protein